MVSRAQRTRPKVGISGSYGGLNLGDEAILQSMVAQLRASLPVEITVFTRNAADTRRRHDVDNVVAIRELSRREARSEVENLDAFVLGGGGILYDADIEVYTREVFLAHEAHVPMMLYAASAGPLTDAGMRKLVREALTGAAALTVRDRQSRQLLEEVGVPGEVTVTADPAVLLDTSEQLTLEEILRAEAIDPEARLVGFSVREPGPAAPDLDIEHYHELVANVADYMVARLKAEVVFFPLERRSFDVQHSHGVVARMRHAQNATVLKRDYTSGQLVSLLRHFHFAIGMRLHFLIFAALAGVPFVALPYASKVTAFLDDLGIESPPFEQVSAGQLIAVCDEAWDLRKDLRAKIQRNLVGLQDRARQSNDILVRLLSSRSAPQRRSDDHA